MLIGHTSAAHRDHTNQVGPPRSLGVSGRCHNDVSVRDIPKRPRTLDCKLDLALIRALPRIQHRDHPPVHGQTTRHQPGCSDSDDRAIRAITGNQPRGEAGFGQAEYRLGIQVLRHAFNARHGLFVQFPLPRRERGDPPQKIGLVANRTLDMETMAAGYFAFIGVDPESGLPLPDTIRDLELVMELS